MLNDRYLLAKVLMRIYRNYFAHLLHLIVCYVVYNYARLLMLSNYLVIFSFCRSHGRQTYRIVTYQALGYMDL